MQTCLLSNRGISTVKQSKKILIADRIPSLNKGELAILEGIIRTFETLGRVEVSIFSFQPEPDQKRYPENVKLVDLSHDFLTGFCQESSKTAKTIYAISSLVDHLLFGFLYFIFRRRALRIFRGALWREYCEVDAIITCHDQESIVLGPSTLPFLPLYIVLLAKTLRKPLVIYGNDTPRPGSELWERSYLGNRLWEKLARFVLKNADLVTARDSETFAYFKKLTDKNSHVYLTADPAFLMPPSDVERVKAIVRREKIERRDGLLIGITCGFHNFLGETLEKQSQLKKRIVEHLADLLDRLIENFAATVVFLPHSIEQNRDDRVLAEAVYQKARNKHGIVVITNEYSARELKGLINTFDIFIGGRIHSLISATSMAVPSIAIVHPSDSRAYGIIAGTMNQSKWIYVIKDPSNLKGLFEMVKKLISDRHAVSSALIRQARIARENALLNGELLKALLMKPDT